MDYTIKVENGVIVSAVNHGVWDDSVSRPAERDVTLTDFTHLMTVEKYFETLKRAYLTGAKVKLNYDQSDVIPSAGIDWQPNAIDDEQGISIKGLTFD